MGNGQWAMGNGQWTENLSPSLRLLSSWVFLLTSILGVLMGAGSAEAQEIRPFTPRFQTGSQGNIRIIGNTLLTCPPPPPATPGAACATARNALTRNNAEFNMVYVDLDGNPTTFNSSSTTLNLPLGATVLWAGLYWGAYSQTTPLQSNSPETQVLFRPPGTATYTQLNATQFDLTMLPTDTVGQRYPYQGFAEVTNLVRVAGNGEYFVANVRAQTNRNRYAGWTLIVVYRDPALPFRTLTVFDGFAVVRSDTNPTLGIQLSNFLTPPTGQFDAFLATIAYEGDGGAMTSGDSFQVNNTPLSNATNPANDFFNGSISGLEPFSKNPNFVNQLGVDIDVVNANASGLVIPNNVRTATATFNTNNPNEAYFPGAFTLGIDSVLLSITKTGPASVTPASNLVYTITVTNNGPAVAENVQVNDPTPTGLSFVSNTSTSTSAGISCNTAYPCNLGIMQPGETVTITTTYAVPPTYTEPNPITNTASVTSDTDPAVRTAEATTSVAPAAPADLRINKTGPAEAARGSNVAYTITVTNDGPADAIGASVTDAIPPELTFVGNAGDCTTPFPCSLETIPVGESRTITTTLAVPAEYAGANPIQNTATVNSPSDTNPENNTSSASTPIVSPNTADLRINKTGPAEVTRGSNVAYTITVTNDGPADATDVSVTDTIPPGLTFVDNAGDCTTPFPCNLGILPAGQSRTITTTLAIPAEYAGANPIQNTATANSPSDTNPENNTSSASTSVGTEENPRLGVAKQITNVVNNGNGTYDVTYNVLVRNEGNVLLNNLQLTENLSATYGTTPFTVVSPPSSNNLAVNPNFTGTGSNLNLLTGTDTLTVGESRTLNFTVRVTPGTNLGPYNNTVQGNATSPSGTPATDDSADGANPDPNNDGNSNNDSSPTSVSFIETPRLGVAKAVSSLVNNNNGTFDLNYTVTVRNYGGVVLNNLQLRENLTATFGETPFTVVSPPTSNNLSINRNFNGTSNTDLLTGTDPLRPSQVATVVFTVRITPGANRGPYNNTVQGSGTTPGGQRTTDTDDDSVNGPDPDPDGDSIPQNNTTPTPVTLPVATEPSRLRLVKRITNVTRNGTLLSGVNFSRFVDDVDLNDNAPGWPANFLLGVPQLETQTPVQSGDEVEYTLYFLSDGGQAVRDFRFCDPIPAGTTFVRNSFGGDAGISLNRVGTVQTRTNLSDADEGAFFSPLSPLPSGNACGDPANSNGAVLVNLDNISNTAGSNFGFIRFRVQID